MTRVRGLAAGIVLLLAAAAPALAQRCALDGAAAAVQPGWVTGALPAEPGQVSAVGVAEGRGAAGLDAVRDAARGRALAELAQQILATVDARLGESLEKVTEAGRTRVTERFTSVNEVQSRLALRNAQVAEQWVDAAGCRLWVRVRLAQAEADRARAAALSDAAAAGLRARLAQAADPARAATERLGALAEARELARLADPALTPGYSRDGFELQAAELDGQLAALRDRDAQARAAITGHVQAMAQGNASAPGPARRAAFGRALQALDSALTLAPQGVPGLVLPFNPTERLATLHAELGVPCVGRQWFERRNLPLPTALQAARPEGCTPAQLAQERRALFFDGKTVALNCTLTLAGAAPVPWPKACGSLQTMLAADGAQIATTGAAADVRIEMHAQGSVQARPDSEAARAGWRFQGQVRSAARGAGQLDVADAYEGLTGWNPVSAQMATDLLALGVVKRLETALNAFWEKR